MLHYAADAVYDYEARFTRQMRIVTDRLSHAAKAAVMGQGRMSHGAGGAEDGGGYMGRGRRTSFGLAAMRRGTLLQKEALAAAAVSTVGAAQATPRRLSKAPPGGSSKFDL